MKIELVKIDTEFNTNSPYCWVQTRAGIFPDGRVLITSQPLRLSGSDIFYGINCFFSKDHACSWNGPIEQKLQRRPFANNQEIVLCDVTPEYHDRSCKMLGIGHTAIYQNDDFPKERHPHYTAYSVFNESDDCWGEFKLLRLPEVFMDHYSSSCSQRVDLDDGTILLPIYHRSKNTGLNAREVTVIRCSFDGENLHYMEHGNTLNSTIHNGLCEPSVFKFKDKFYLTMRNYECGLVSQSNDGLNYSEAVKWRFDDGKEIGNYNTQQHWLSLEKNFILSILGKGQIMITFSDTGRRCLWLKLIQKTYA